MSSALPLIVMNTGVRQVNSGVSGVSFAAAIAAAVIAMIVFVRFRAQQFRRIRALIVWQSLLSGGAKRLYDGERGPVRVVHTQKVGF